MEDISQVQILLARIDERQQNDEKTLAAILEQTKKTNGRVTNLEDDVTELQNGAKEHDEFKSDFSKLEESVKKIENKIQEQNITKESKKNVWSQIFEVIKWVALGYLVVKGVLGIDILFGGKFL